MSAAVCGWLMLACLSVGFFLGACWQSMQGVKWSERLTPDHVPPVSAVSVLAAPRGGSGCNCFVCKPLPRIEA